MAIVLILLLAFEVTIERRFVGLSFVGFKIFGGWIWMGDIAHRSASLVVRCLTHIGVKKSPPGPGLHALQGRRLQQLSLYEGFFGFG